MDTTQKDLYQILGLSKSATEDEIKRSYRKLALKYHPDRQGGKSDAEKKEAEAKFKDVSFAYSILSDTEKRQRYDQYGVTDDQQMGAGFDPTDIFSHFMRGMGGFSGGPFHDFFHDHGSQLNAEPGQSIQINVPVGIEDILKGVHRDIKYDIHVRCTKCHGAGGEGVKQCPHCGGTGMVTEMKRMGFGIIQNSYMCPHCQGTGKYVAKTCLQCGGTGFETREASISVNVPSGFENGYQEYHHGKGSEAKDPHAPNGDILLNFVYNIDASKYVIQGNAVYEKIEVPYYDCILGCKMKKTFPTGDKVEIVIPEYSSEGTVVNSGKWFGKLNYKYVVVVKMPSNTSNINNTEKDCLKKIQKQHS